MPPLTDVAYQRMLAERRQRQRRVERTVQELPHRVRPDGREDPTALAVDHQRARVDQRPVVLAHDEHADAVDVDPPAQVRRRVVRGRLREPDRAVAQREAGHRVLDRVVLRDLDLLLEPSALGVPVRRHVGLEIRRRLDAVVPARGRVRCRRRAARCVPWSRQRPWAASAERAKVIRVSRWTRPRARRGGRGARHRDRDQGRTTKRSGHGSSFREGRARPERRTIGCWPWDNKCQRFGPCRTRSLRWSTRARSPSISRSPARSSGSTARRTAAPGVESPVVAAGERTIRTSVASVSRRRTDSRRCGARTRSSSPAGPTPTTCRRPRS